MMSLFIPTRDAAKNDEVQGGGDGRCLVWNFSLVPYQAWVFKNVRRSCLKDSAWNDPLWQRARDLQRTLNT